MSTKVKSRRKKYVSLEEGRDSPLGGADTSVFSSRDTMTTHEREAVKKGEKRGENITMAENPEKYGNIASINQRQYNKNAALIFGDCKKCEKFTGKTDHPGEHCSLSETEKCIG
jgi:hypothetical protein